MNKFVIHAKIKPFGIGILETFLALAFPQLARAWAWALLLLHSHYVAFPLFPPEHLSNHQKI
jgi:hypothetical protein